MDGAQQAAAMMDRAWLVLAALGAGAATLRLAWSGLAKIFGDRDATENALRDITLGLFILLAAKVLVAAVRLMLLFISGAKL